MGSARNSSLDQNRANGSVRSLLPGRWRNPQRGAEGYHHIDESLVQRAVKEAVRTAGIVKRAAYHTYRPPVPGISLRQATTFAPGRELLVHQDVRITMIYTHVLNRGGRGVRSPADPL